MKRLYIWSKDKRALSPIFATVLLATIIIVFGSVAYYFSSNITQTATNNYVSTLSNSQQSIAERLSLENVNYDAQTKLLNVFIINSGSANNVKLGSIFLYDGTHTIVGGSPYDLSKDPNYVLKNIDTDALIHDNTLNAGKEAYFSVTLGIGLPSGSIYTIHLITQSGSSFDYDFNTA